MATVFDIPGTDPFGRVNRKDTAAALGVSAGTLANWNTHGIGPKAYKSPTGGKVFYMAEDVRAFALRSVAS